MNNKVNKKNTRESLNNLTLIKKQLYDPLKFRNTEYTNKACFSQAYKKYGFLETWDVAINLLNNLPHNENVFNELILDSSKVKPYLDVEWLKETFPDYDPDTVKAMLKDSLVDILKTDFSYDLKKSDIYVAKCHRNKNDGYKYSFHVIISSHPTIVFENTNYASFLAIRMKTHMKNKGYDESIIDGGVYKKTQNIRLPGHCKEGDFTPITMEDSENILEYIITNIDKNHICLQSSEQEDMLYKSIQNKTSKDFKYDKIDLDFIINTVKSYHPSSYLENIDETGFLQFNYKDRKEPCFTGKKIYHDKIGFFVYVYDNIINIGCHSGNCVDVDNTKVKKIIKVIGSLPSRKNLTFEKVDFENSFDISPIFIKECINNGALGISNLFEKMYLHPKRIKWINDSNFGSSYFWDGKLWQQDDYSFIERLLVTTIVRVLRNFQSIYKYNNEISDEEISLLMDISNKIITKLNDGLLINNIIKFVKPLIRDTEFSKIKDIHPYFLSCKNGMVDLVTGVLRSSVPEDNITKALDTSYNINADSSDFDKFVRQITSNEEGEDTELYDFFKWCIGYAMQGSPKKKIFLILYGPHGFNGKSLVMNTIKDILETYAVSMDSSVVLDNGSKKTAGSHSTELCQLENCRIGLLSDTKEDAAIDDGRMKQLTGITDKMSAREIYGKQKEFTPTFVPFISTNHPIQVNLSDKAMYERLILFPFVLSFVDNPVEKYQKKADNSLAENFKNNKEGILKWLIEASVYYNKDQNKVQPKAILDAKDKYNKQVNTYLDFLDTTFIITKNDADMVKRVELMDAYKLYMSQNNMINKYKARISEREFDKILSYKTKGCKMYLGIKYKDDDIDNVYDDLS